MGFVNQKCSHSPYYQPCVKSVTELCQVTQIFVTFWWAELGISIPYLSLEKKNCPRNSAVNNVDLLMTLIM